jgi:hypothetical protein
MQVSPHVRNDQAGVPFRVEVASDATSVHLAMGIASANHRVAAGLVSAGGEATFIMDNTMKLNSRI